MSNRKLLLVGYSNWNYYLEGNLVMAIAKPGSGAKDCCFGSVEYFRQWVRNEHAKDDRIEGRLTALGFKVTGIGVTPKGVNPR